MLQSATQPEALPIPETAGVVLLVSLLITAVWLALLYR